MLLYNQRKEFVGIDEDDLSSLDFKNINELQNESEDFADLFVKKPGYIHNFKNFSWIDFIQHSENDESKAIIHAKGVNYSCTLHVASFHFTADESGYAVTVNNLTALKGVEDAQARKDLDASGGLQTSASPVAASVPTPNAAPIELDISLDDMQKDLVPPVEDEPEPELPSFEASFDQDLNEPDPLDIPESQDMDLDLFSSEEELQIEPTFQESSTNEFGAPVESSFSAPSPVDFDAPLNIEDDLVIDHFNEPNAAVNEPEEVETEAPIKDEKPMLGDYVSPAGSEHLSELVSSGEYIYDPNVAANELGLPVDLIEEFIGDFIEQAHEFKDDLYASVNGGDYDNVQVLSHKLKGVAANLRVEDAFDVLSVVNISKDNEEVLPNLNEFYIIIAKLEGKEVPQATEPEPVAAPLSIPEPIAEIPEPLEELDLAIGIKQPIDGPMLIDEAVVTADDDDLYADLLGTPDSSIEPEPVTQIQDTAPDPMDDDIYGDLLAEPSFEDETPIAEPNFTDETPIAEPSFLDDSINDDLYDDLLADPTPEVAPEIIPEAISTQIEVPPMNFDAQSSANQLGIPVDIVKEFVGEFKEQVATHKVDFDNAIMSQDIQGINATATLLKGMSDNLRLLEISEVLKELQSETNINNTTDALAKLQAYADQL